jgi:hypothetical protein
LQAELGQVDFSKSIDRPKFKKQFFEMTQDIVSVFQIVSRIVRYIRECLIHSRNAVAVKNIITLENCIQARAWHDTANVFKQLRGVGSSYVRILSHNGIKSFDDLRVVEPERLEVWCHRSTPFGHNLLKDLRQIPRYDLKITKHSTGTLASEVDIQVVLIARISTLNSKESGNCMGYGKLWTTFLAAAHGVLFDHLKFR